MTPSSISVELKAAAAGDAEAFARLIPLVYDELHAIAAARLRGERRDHTLGAGDLVHETYLRLLRDASPDWPERARFFAAAAEAMRRILIEHARARGRAKRGGDAEGRAPRRLSFTESEVADLAAATDENELLELVEAVERLARLDRRAAEVLRLRFFAGLGVEETASALGVAPRTVKRDWSFARAWLFRELGGRGR